MKNSKRNARIIAEWNSGHQSKSDIAEIFGVSRNTITGVLERARNRGVNVLSFSPSERTSRQHRALRKSGMDAYLASMREKAAHARSVRWPA